MSFDYVYSSIIARSHRKSVSSFDEVSILSSTAVVIIYIPTSCAYVFLFLHWYIPDSNPLLGRQFTNIFHILMSLHSIDNYLCCAEASNFYIIPLVRFYFKGYFQSKLKELTCFSLSLRKSKIRLRHYHLWDAEMTFQEEFKFRDLLCWLRYNFLSA